jgi:membrane protein DedA with SNARE-associated domain
MLTSHWDDMTFLAVAAGSLLGSFLGNMGVFWVIGAMAQRAERKKLEELHKLQQSYLEMVERERTRLEKYAKMEG